MQTTGKDYVPPIMGEGVNPVKIPVKIFFLLDKSGSMAHGNRMASLNDAIPVTIKALEPLLEGNPDLEINIKVISFCDKVNFYITGSEGKDLKDFNWIPMTPEGGETHTATAIEKLCEQLSPENMPEIRGRSPVCILISDGYCTEDLAKYDAAIQRLDSIPWGKKAARMVISIGKDVDEVSLKKFVNDRGRYINCEDASTLVEHVKTGTTFLTQKSIIGHDPNKLAGS